MDTCCYISLNFTKQLFLINFGHQIKDFCFLKLNNLLTHNGLSGKKMFTTSKSFKFLTNLVKKTKAKKFCKKTKVLMKKMTLRQSTVTFAI